MVSPRRHPGVAAQSYRQRKELEWFPLASRVLQLAHPSPFAALKRFPRVWLEAEERLDRISRVRLEASARECGWQDHQHPLSLNLLLEQVEALIVGHNLSETRDTQVGGCSLTSDSQSAKVGMPLVVEVPVILSNDWDNWKASLNCKMKGALLEWP